MSGPFIFIATNRLKEGKFEEERRRVPGLCDFIEGNEPRLIAFNEYASEDGTEVGVVQIHPDAESMEFHMEVVGERAARAYAETAGRNDEHRGVRRAQRRRAGDVEPTGRGGCSDGGQAAPSWGFTRARPS